MWCYQKPGFEALLLAELQNQQQSSQFCDTLLQADGVSVPAHSCILSAISPQFLSSLSSTQGAAAGCQKILEFGAIRAHTLFHLVQLLYSGKMVGKGETEKQEAISAASKLGIHGLLEVSVTDGQQRGPHEVGVQTESQMFEEHVRPGTWRREVGDGATVFGRERLPSQNTEMWTQTEDGEINCASSSQPPVAFETIDLNALQDLRQVDSLQFSYVPTSVVVPNDKSHSSVLSSVSAAAPSVHYSTYPTNYIPISSQAPTCAVEVSPWGPEVGRTGASEEWSEEGLEQFEGNIPEFINYFLDPEKDGRSNRRPGRRGQSAGVQGSRQAEKRASGRRGRLTQMVKEQDVGVTSLSKTFRERWAIYMNRVGQGGGAVGRMLFIKTRGLIRSGRCTPRRKVRGMEWSNDLHVSMSVKAENGKRSHRGRLTDGRNTQQLQSAPSRREKEVTKADAKADRVMMGLDILPNSKKNRRSTISGSSVPKERRPASEVTVSSKSSELSSFDATPILQQPQDRALTDILDQFLMSFEQLECEATQDSAQATQPFTECRKNNSRLPMHAPGPLSVRPASPKTPVCSQVPKQRSGKGNPPAKRPKKKRGYLLSEEKLKTKSKKTTKSDALTKEEAEQRARAQLKQMPVVKLERRGALPTSTKILDLKLQELTGQCPGSSAEKSQSYPLLWKSKIYPIRSRFKEAQILDVNPFLEEPLSDHTHRDKLLKNTHLPILSQDGGKMDGRKDKGSSNARRLKTRGWKRLKRRAKSDEQNSEVEMKRICFNDLESCSESTDPAEVVEVETVAQTSTCNMANMAENEDEEAPVVEDASDSDADSVDVIVVDKDQSKQNEGDMVHAEVICSLRANLVAKTSDSEEWDDELDVTGGSSPAPAPVLISWTDSSESADDSEVEVPEEQTVTLSKGQLVRC